MVRVECPHINAPTATASLYKQLPSSPLCDLVSLVSRSLSLNCMSVLVLHLPTGPIDL